MRITIIILTLFGITSALTAQKIDCAKIKVERSIEVDDRIPEGSGLTFWDGKLWTHNDSGFASLFALDMDTGGILAEYPIPNVRNTDWEELSQDSLNFYIGDFGNNFAARDTLQIIRIDKQSLLTGNPKTDLIRFTWETRDNPDCEAMVVISDSIYLFTKEWKNKRRTRIFSVPARPGMHQAKYVSTLNSKVAVTGATYQSGKLVLCGYNRWIKPHLLEFTKFSGTRFFEGNIRKIKIRKCFTQIEGIATSDGKNYYAISELFKFLFIRNRQKLHSIKP